MKIKRYLDSDMRSVLRRVREDQGPDAVILSNRRTEEGIEVIAAIDYDESILQQAFGGQPDVDDYLRVAEPAEPDSGEDDTAGYAVVAADLHRVAGDSTSDSDSGAAADAIATAIRAAAMVAKLNEAETADATGKVSESRPLPIENLQPVAPKEIPVEVAPARADNESLDRMWTEISSIRGLMESQLSELVWQEQERRSPMRAQVIRNLARMGIASDIAARIVGRLDATAPTKQVWRAPLAELVDMMPVGDDSLLTEGGVAALVGPTGVGKTTSVAKLAARWVMAHGSDDLALISADAYRIGAKEHLAAFAQIIGTRVHSASGPTELATLLECLQTKKLVLIDTDGVSQRDSSLVGRLEEYARHLSGVRFYLTLSAASQESTLNETIRRFRQLPLAGAIVSKIDEAGQLGCVMSALIRSELPALWFADGQKIPDDFHEASKKKLWLLTQAIECMEASEPNIDEHIMAQQYALASVAHA